MEKGYKVFTVQDGAVTQGALVESLELKGAGITIPAILVGESGRGRQRGVLPVEGAEEGQIILAASVGQTRAGKPKLFSCPSPTTDEAILVVFRTGMGFRGSNAHTGDRVGWNCRSCDTEGEGSSPSSCPKCGRDVILKFREFPGTVLVSGIIADGLAGRMGSGDQLVAIIPKNVVFRTARFGRLYGRPGSYYYLWDGETLLSATWEEREMSEIF